MPSSTWLLWVVHLTVFFDIQVYTPYRVNITGSSAQFIFILVSALFCQSVRESGPGGSTLGLCDFIHRDLDPIRPGWLHVFLSVRTFDSMWFTGSLNGVKVLFLPED